MKLREIKITPPIAAISVMLLVLTGAAAPKIVYVVPGGAGTKDGTSWENAYDTVEKAYTSATAYEAAGCDSGEVWVKAGRYVTGKLTLVSNVSVHGGFAGDETAVSQANPTENRTILTGDTSGDSVWWPNGEQPEGPAQPIWTGDDLMTYNPPDLDGAYDYYRPHKGATNDKEWLFYSSGVALSNCTFSGFVITCYVRNPVDVETGSTSGLHSSGITVRDCTFLANGSYWSAYGYNNGIYFINTDGVVSNCVFSDNVCAGYFSCSIPDILTHVDLVDCVIERCARNGVYLGYKNNGDGFALTRCTFRRNHAYESNTGTLSASQPAGVGAASDLLITDCVFDRNVTKGAANGAVNLYSNSNYAQPTFTRCSFLTNRLVSTGSFASYQSACIYNGGMQRVARSFNCSFIGNTAESDGLQGCASAYVGNASTAMMFCYNCTFTNNSAKVTTAGAYAGTVMLGMNVTRLALLNCTLVGNTASAPTAHHAADFMVAEGWGNTWPRILNSVLWSPSDDYVAFDVTKKSGDGKVSTMISNSIVKNMDKDDLETGRAVATFTHYQDVDTTCEDPCLGELKFSNGTGAIGVTLSSPYRKNGYQIWISADGAEPAFYDPKFDKNNPWLTLYANNQGKMNDEAAAAKGYNRLDPSVPDAFGAARVEGKVAYGPLNAIPGLMLLLR